MSFQDLLHAGKFIFRNAFVDKNGLPYGIDEAANAIPVCPEEHHSICEGEFTSTSGGVIAVQAIITPPANKIIDIHNILIHTEASGGTINLDFLASGTIVARLYVAKESRFSADRDHSEGSADEALTFSASGIGNSQRVFIKIGYVLEDS